MYISCDVIEKLNFNCPKKMPKRLLGIQCGSQERFLGRASLLVEVMVSPRRIPVTWLLTATPPSPMLKLQSCKAQHIKGQMAEASVAYNRFDHWHGMFEIQASIRTGWLVW